MDESLYRYKQQEHLSTILKGSEISMSKAKVTTRALRQRIERKLSKTELKLVTRDHTTQKALLTSNNLLVLSGRPFEIRAA